MTVPAAASGDFVFVNLFRGTAGTPRMQLDAVKRPSRRRGPAGGHRPAAPPASAQARFCVERP